MNAPFFAESVPRRFRKLCLIKIYSKEIEESWSFSSDEFYIAVYFGCRTSQSSSARISRSSALGPRWPGRPGTRLFCCANAFFADAGRLSFKKYRGREEKRGGEMVLFRGTILGDLTKKRHVSCFEEMPTFARYRRSNKQYQISVVRPRSPGRRAWLHGAQVLRAQRRHDAHCVR